MNSILDKNNYKAESSLLTIGFLDKDLNPNKRIICSSSMGPDLSSMVRFDYQKMVINSLSNDLRSNFDREILREMSSKNEDYLNVIGKSDIDSVDILFKYLKYHDYDFIITSPPISHMISSNKYLGYNSVDNFKFKNDMISIVGEVYNITCFVDSYKRYDDIEIICGRKKDFSYNYNIRSVFYAGESTFSPRVTLDMETNICLGNSFTKLIFANKYDEKYKILNRDIKIDELLS